MCNLGNLWSLSLDFSNRVWHGQLSCPRSFLWRLLWVLLFVGETWRNRQTWVSIFWERKSKVDDGLLTRVLAFVLLSSQNLKKLLGCLDIISHELWHVTAHLTSFQSVLDSEQQCSVSCASNFYYFRPDKLFPFSKLFLCMFDAFFSFWSVQRLQD